MTLREFRDILKGVAGVSVSHNKAINKTDNYIVWHEVSGLSLKGDNTTLESGARIAVDFFTKSEYSVTPAAIVAALDASDEIFHDDAVIDYEDDTGFYHYAYTVEVVT